MTSPHWLPLCLSLSLSRTHSRAGIKAKGRGSLCVCERPARRGTGCCAPERAAFADVGDASALPLPQLARLADEYRHLLDTVAALRAFAERGLDDEG